MMALATLFVVIAAGLCVAALLALLGTAHLALSGAAAIERDGLARGRRAPSWTLPGQDGLPRTSPPARGLQLIMFADHSLRSFPSVVAGLRALADEPELSIVVLTRGLAGHAAGVAAQLGLAGIDVAAGSAALYSRYNVRVMPFAIIVDDAGLVRASSLVNHDWQLRKLAQVAALPLGAGEGAGRRRRFVPAGAAGGGAV